MADSKISALTGASAVDAANEFAINEAGTSKKVTAQQIKNFVELADADGYIPVRILLRANATRTFTSNTSSQALFTTPTNGRMTLPTGVYKFEALLSLSGMSGTSGNALISMIGAGTATIGKWLWDVMGIDGATATAAARNGQTIVTAASGAAIVTATTATAMQLRVTGTFEVTVAGTLIPSMTMLTASASVLAIGSYVIVERMGATGITSQGPVD